MITAVYTILIDGFYLYREIQLNYLPNEGEYIAFLHKGNAFSTKFKELLITHRSDGLLFLESVCNTENLSKNDIEDVIKSYVNHYGFIRCKSGEDPLLIYKVKELES